MRVYRMNTVKYRTIVLVPPMIKIGEEVIVVPKLETERLILRALSPEDMDFLLRHFGDEDVNRYSSYENLKNREEAIDFYNRFIEPGKPTRFRLGIVLEETGELVGTLGYHNLSRRDHSAEIGYDLSKAYWGEGIMTEAVEALLRYGFERMNLNRIEATVDSENSRSIRLLEIRFHERGATQREILLQRAIPR